MSKIEFVSHEEFPEDPYTKEIVYLCLEEKYRVAYVRKQAKNGGFFWSVPSICVTKDGMKTYYEGFLQDSTFMEKDIKSFLESKPWAKKAYIAPVQSSPEPVKATLFNENDLPF